jgi:hypothetical protein
MGKNESEKKLPLFEYAKGFEDFETYSDFDSYLIYCIHTSGFPKKDIAHAMLLSDSGLSIRMSQSSPEAPRFNVNHLQAYIEITGDPRPWQYLKWRTERASIPKEKTVMEMVNHLNVEMKRLNNLLEKNG